MKKSKIIAFIVFILAAILAILFYFVDDGTVNVGTWSKTPIENLNDFAGAGITYTELKTVYLGENGKNGALLFYLERDDDAEEPVLNIGFFESKYKSGKHLYSHYSSYSEWTETLNKNDIVLKTLPDGSHFNCFVALSQLDKADVYDQYYWLEDVTIDTVQFELKDSRYSLQYIIQPFATKDEAQSFEEFVNNQESP